MLKLSMFAGSMLLAGAALAQDAAMPGGPAAAPTGDMAATMRTRIMTADTDHDGRLSAQEFTTMMAAMPNGNGMDPAKVFARLDTDHDGYLSSSEIDAMIAMRMQRMRAGGGTPPAPPQ